MHDPDSDPLMPAEAAFQRAAAAAKYVARKLSAANSLEEVAANRVAELADLLEKAKALYDALAEEAEFLSSDPALGDTQVAVMDSSFAKLHDTLVKKTRPTRG